MSNSTIGDALFETVKETFTGGVVVETDTSAAEIEFSTLDLDGSVMVTITGQWFLAGDFREAAALFNRIAAVLEQ